jgi:hypothetical protein
MDESMTSTTFTLPGCHVAETLGVVRGVTVRSRSLFGTIGAMVETLFEGHISMRQPCERPGRRLRHPPGHAQRSAPPRWASGMTPRDHVRVTESSAAGPL